MDKKEYFNPMDALPEEMKKKYTKEKNRKKISSSYIEIIEDFCSIIEAGQIPKELGDMIIKENSDSNYTLLIHRAKVEREQVLKNGLIIGGGNDLGYTTSRYSNKLLGNLMLLREIIVTPQYKESTRCVIMKIPNTALKYTEGKSKPILLKTNNAAEQSGGMVSVENRFQTALLPEYILGTVEYDKEGKILGFEKNSGYKDMHNHINDGLTCTSELIDDYISKHKTTVMDDIYIDEKVNLQKIRERENFVDEIIKNENTKYMENHLEEYMMQNNSERLESDIKEYAKKGLGISKFNKMAIKIKQFFEKEKIREEQEDVDR